MAVDLRGVPTVLLPGTGSDDDFVYRVFCDVLHQVEAVPIPHKPQPGALIAGYIDALESAAAHGPIAIGGVSIGSAVAVSWAITHPQRVVAVLAALPAWTGEPTDTPAALSALQTAHHLRQDGLGATTARMQASSPAWLADELTRSWVGQWPALPEAMTEAAHYVAPSIALLETLQVPMGVAAASDDPIHPLDVGVEWVAAAPYASLRTLTLAQIGADPAALGAACFAALADV
jgi:pimeloyl-ACP methyl ester carboxylesterase